MNFTAIVIIDNCPREAEFNLIRDGLYYLVKIEGMDTPLRITYWYGEWIMHNGRVTDLSTQLAKIIARETSG